MARWHQSAETSHSRIFGTLAARSYARGDDCFRGKAAVWVRRWRADFVSRTSIHLLTIIRCHGRGAGVRIAGVGTCSAIPTADECCHERDRQRVGQANACFAGEAVIAILSRPGAWIGRPSATASRAVLPRSPASSDFASPSARCRGASSGRWIDHRCGCARGAAVARRSPPAGVLPILQSRRSLDQITQHRLRGRRSKDDRQDAAA